MDELAAEFWAWRIATQPDSGDDVARVNRPPGWQADWSAAAIAARRSVLAGFDRRHRALGRDLERRGAAVAEWVDYRLVGSALARVHWELDLLRGWQRNPCFYLDQCLVPVFNLLLASQPFGQARVSALVRLLWRVPALLEQGCENLTGIGASFATQALRLLDDHGASVAQAMAALAPVLPESDRQELSAATDAATNALASFGHWLATHEAIGAAPVGAQAFGFFLHRVALLPYSVEQIRAIGQREFHRAVAAEAVLRRRGRAAAPAEMAPVADLPGREREAELAVRRFYRERGLLSQPEGLRHYTFATMPSYLAPLCWLGVPHEVTGPDRVDEPAVRYLVEAAPQLPYFEAAKARDPRTGIVHEGVHAQQLALSWRHPDPVRRHFYDSTPNEGIAFYNEELMLLAGLFDDAPDSAVFLANSMRLRALRVEIDLGLALGELSPDQAADILAGTVPMDRATAEEEAAFFAGNPGQALSYQLGKTQILDLIAACAVRRPGFDLQSFHDRLWREGNVPLALQRWELLGLRDHLDEADQLAGQQP